ncbi:MFS transporter [Streptomyces antimicrobicus]|uniref:MFS transporter n=1 Tax=Streptomyces antimicrobicus TaxID=2883108 RepID=A0ABS8B6X0_9ACTN|nr:MFS transporter [Streptomyces antimicrobicus]MCB5180364.1 MFS transporter [Streptomyces antimicrobicus]
MTAGESTGGAGGGSGNGNGNGGSSNASGSGSGTSSSGTSSSGSSTDAGPGRPAPADHPGRAPRPRTAVVAALMLTMGLAALEGTIVATAVPQIVGDLGGFSVFSWLFSGYLLAVTVSLPVYGKLSDTFGRKPVLLFGIALFLVGCLLCSVAWNMAALIAFRIVQGLGGGALQGTVQTLAADLYPLKDRLRIQARMSTVWATSAVGGPALGGLLAAYAHWRWIFLINLPVGVVALWLIHRHLREPARTPAAPRGPIDWAGALAVFACGGTLLFAVVQGGVAWPWLSAPSLALLATSAALAVLVVRIERRAEEPVLPGWVWRRRTIAAVNLAMAALGVVMVAPVVFVPTYAQSVLGLDPISAGFVMSGMTLSWPVTAALSQHVYRRIGFRNSAALGIGLAAVVLFSFTLLPHPARPWQPALIMLLLGAALGLFQLPLIVGVQSTVGWGERGTTTASVLFCRQVGQSLGAAALGAVANLTIGARLADAAVPGLPTRLDDVSQALDRPDLVPAAAAEQLRGAVATAVDHIFLGASAAAVAALLVLLVVAPRRFPVLPEQRED